MCAIVGYLKRKNINDLVQPSILNNMRDSMWHRGPDDAGSFISTDRKIGLAHRRLSIIDLSKHGRQPMTNEDSTIWLTYNGEIYNFHSIKEILLKKGHIFKSHTDSEVIIHAYEEFGIDCIQLFEGMFAFALYDENKNKLFLVRDRFGIKPLYYGFLDSNTFAFSSELKGLSENPSFKKEIDNSALGDFFYYRYIPAPKSIWKNIFKLTHGSYIEFDIKSFNIIQIKKYYELSNVLESSNISSMEEVEDLINQAVKKRLISDVEIGTLLSGGVDSASISAIARKYHPKINSFTIGFNDLRDESSYAKEIARYLKIPHFINFLNDLDFQTRDNMATCYDEPFADDSLFPTFALSKLTRKHVTVALSGDGGDEVFSGYIWYKRYIDQKKKLNAKSFSFFKRKKTFESQYHDLMGFGINSNSLKIIFSKKVFNYWNHNNSYLFEKYRNDKFSGVRQLQYIDFNSFLSDQILVKVDRASMANSLEVRVPMLDHKLIEAVFRLKEEDFPSNSFGKPVLKNLIQKELPSSVFERSKRGFGAPLYKWDAFNYRNLVSYVLKGEALKSGLFNKKSIENIFLSNNKELNKLQHYIFQFYCLEVWYKKWGS